MRSNRLQFPPRSFISGRSKTGVLLGNGEGWGCLLVVEGSHRSGKHHAGTAELCLSSAEEEWESRWRKPVDRKDPSVGGVTEPTASAGKWGNAAIEDPGTVSVRAMNKSLAAHLLC